MTKDKDFEKSFRLSKIGLQLSGIEMFPEKISSGFGNLVRQWLFYLNLIWLYPDVIGEFYWVIHGFLAGKTFDELSMSAPCAAICLLATVKSSPLYYNRDVIKNVIDKLGSIHPDILDEEHDSTNHESIKYEHADDNFEGTDSKKPDKNMDGNSRKDLQRKIVKDAIKFLNMAVMFLYYLSVVVVIVFIMAPIGSMLYDYWRGRDVNLKIPFNAKYFFDPFTSVSLPLVYFHQFWSTVIVATNVFAADSLFYALCIYFQMHFRLLRHQFEDVVSTSNTATKENFRMAVKRHQELIELVEQTELLYTKSTLFNIMSSSLLICLSGFIITFVDDVGTVLCFVTFLIMSLCQIFLLCFFGDMLMTSSTQVFEAVYNCKWYEADQDIKRCVLLVMIRALRPCKLTAMNFADLNLRAFTTILSRSWSYFALLKTIMDD